MGERTGMVKIDIKPIGINVQYQGRRFLSPIGKQFKTEATLKIRKVKVPEGKLLVKLEFGFSNSDQDIDGPVKSVLDILQKKLGFNDNRVYRIEVDKKIVKKGAEYFAYDITPFTE